jgi:hypothetical protein
VEETAVFENPVCYEWQHHLGEIIGSVIEAGLTIDFVREHPVSTYQRLPQMTRDEAGYWRLPGDSLPMLFSLRATKHESL